MGCEQSKKDEGKKPGLNIGDKKNDKKVKKEIKVVLLGDKAVGKSSLSNRFVFNKFQDEYEITFGGIYNKKEISVNNQVVTVHLWDTAGEERFRSMLSMYYRDAYAGILVFDLTSIDSFNGIKEWIQELENQGQRQSMALYLAGNKCDAMNRTITKQQAEDLANQYQMIYIETSAKLGTGVDLLFQKIGEKYISSQ